jgi:hypothetical protein
MTGKSSVVLMAGEWVMPKSVRWDCMLVQLLVEGKEDSMAEHLDKEKDVKKETRMVVLMVDWLGKL